MTTTATIGRADTQGLISGLTQLPSHWALTPVERKNAYRLDWSKEAPLSPGAIATKIQFGEKEKFRDKGTGEIKERFVRATGYGIRTGEVSGGIIAADADGYAAEALLQKLSNGDLPDTVIFTSGKDGRRQLLYRVPEEYWSVFRTIKLDTGEKDEHGKKQQLEFRWNGCQSVLPPSVHPETGSYHWVLSPIDVQVAECPMWLIELMLNHNTREQGIGNREQRKGRGDLNPDARTLNTELLRVPRSLFPSNITARPPLEIFLGKDDRALVNHGTGDGTRNTAAQKLSLNLVATSRRLGELGIDHLDLPRVLYDLFCLRCTPPLSTKEREGWWKNAAKLAKQPSLDDEKLMGCYRAWLNRQQVSQVQQQRVDVDMPIVKGEAVKSDDERLRLALLDLAQEKDRIAYVRKRAQICRFYSISKAEVEELIKETERKTATSSLQRSSLDDLLEMEIQELTWLIPELLPVGEMVILAGSPKSGKTLMAIDAAFAVATGEDEFLGLKCARGKVLMISNDENPRSTKAKLLKRGFRSGDGKWLEVIFNWTIDRLYELEQVLDDFRPDVVIIDSLKSITTNSEISENSAEFANNIYSLKNLLNQYGCSGLLIHHTNKNKDAMGIGKLRGSTAIAGAVWGTWQLEHVPKPDPNGGKGLIIDPSDPKRVLSVFARDVEGQLLALEFDPENNSYARTDKEVINEQSKLRDRIMAVLRLNPNGLSGREVVEMLGMTTEQKHPVYTELTRMEAKRLLSTVKHHRDKRITIYTLKDSNHANVTECKLVINSGDSLSPPPSIPFDYYSDESHTQQELQNSNQKIQNSNQHTENSNQLVDTQDTDYYSKPSPCIEYSELVIKNEIGGGERVSPEMLNNSTELDTLPTGQQVEVGDVITGADPKSACANHEGQSLPVVAEPQIEVGDAVTHVEPYHVRSNQEGIVEGINPLTGGFVVFWLLDGDNQRHRAHRSYPATELRKL